MFRLFRGGAVALFMMAAAWPQQPSDSKKPAAAFPCADANTQMEVTNCWEDLAKKADANLTAVYQKVQKAIRAKIVEEKGGPLEGYEQRALNKLRAAELAWIHYREVECDAQEQQNEGGTIAPSIHAGCMKELADRRAGDLQKTYAIYLAKH